MALRLGNNVAAISTQRNIRRASMQYSKSLERLSSGFRINRAQDDPAGLIISEKLRVQMAGTSRAVRNAQETSNLFGITESALSEVSNLLKSMRSLALHAANTGSTIAEQTLANQQELDSSISTIERISASTRYGNANMLNGTKDYDVSLGSNVSSVRADQVRFPKQLPVPAAPVGLPMAATLVQEAQAAGVNVDSSGMFALNGGVWETDRATTIEIHGSLGSKRFDFQAGTSIDAFVSAINGASESTGVVIHDGTGPDILPSAVGIYNVEAPMSTAGIVPTNLVFQAATLNSTNGRIVPILGVQGNFQLEDNDQDKSGTYELFGAGTDGFSAGMKTLDTGTAPAGNRAQDLIVQVLGTEFNSKDGKSVTITTGNFVGKVDFDTSWTTDATAVGVVDDATFDVNSGGMYFQLGEAYSVSTSAGFAFETMDPQFLGVITVPTNDSSAPFERTTSLSNLLSGRPDSLSANPSVALRVIDKAIEEVSAYRSRIGAYQKNMLDATERNLSTALENMTSTESMLRDTDIAAESTEFTRTQLLVQAGTQILAQANASTQNVLNLLQ